MMPTSRETVVRTLLLSLLALGLGACPPPRHAVRIYNPPPPPPPPRPLGPPAPLRIIHASPDETLAHTVLTVDGRVAAPDLAFGGAAGYGEVPAGTHAVALHPRQLPPSTPPPLTAQLELHGPNALTLIVHGIVASTPPLAFAQAEDTVGAPEPGHARVRFFHAAVGLGEIEVCVADPSHSAHRPGTPLFASGDEGRFLVAETALTDASPQWAEVIAAPELVLQLREPDPESPCHGTTLGTATIVVPDSARLTLVAVGRVDADPAVDPGLLVCPDGPSPDAHCDRVEIATGR